ncbi:MAG: cytochrome c oxidase accessory protein CcoG [Alphaproteobacteria bacterium]|nr:cytochrome c oxidase accessory protein CcoG [Alphaproteobacteria bacterium]
MAAMLAIYYLAPWLRWDRGPNAPGQAILIDFPERKFYFFFIEIWPQEVYFLTGILIMMAIGLFAVTASFGRIWCGYACPQTVWTDLFIQVERLIEGDRNARMRLDAAPMSASKLGKRALKYAVFLVISMATGGAWVLYFADAPTLAHQLVTFEAPYAAYAAVAFLTASTFVLGGLAREQVCTYMCPYARFQAAMLDEHSLIVAYRADRGEPRGKHKKGDSWEGHGDCVDCDSCVAVCPTGIDIRDGQQLECINCGLCADACDAVMDRVGRPRGLIGIDSLANVTARKQGLPAATRIFRTRTLIYIGIWCAVGLFMLGTLLLRNDIDVNTLRDRNPLFVTLTDGSIRNGYTVHIINKQHAERPLTLSVDGLPSARVNVLGDSGTAAGAKVTVPADGVGEFKVFVTAPRDSVKTESTGIHFIVREADGRVSASRGSSFRGPSR